MLKASLAGAAVTFALIAVPVLHWLTFLPAPFIGGYIGISSARNGPRSPLAKAITFGFLLGGLVLIIAFSASAVVTALADLGRFLWVLWGGVAILVLYTASMSALGALFSLLKAGSKNPVTDIDTEAETDIEINAGTS